MTLHFLIEGRRHTFTLEEARALREELEAFFGNYVAGGRECLPGPARETGRRAAPVALTHLAVTHL